MPFITMLHRKPFWLVVAALFLTPSLFGCASSKPLLGTKPPALALVDAKAALLKANKRNAATHAPLEMEQAKAALSQAEELWSKHRGSSGSTGNVKRDDEIREKVLYAKLYAQVAQAISNRKETEQQIAKIEIDRLKYDSVTKQYQTEEAQIKTIIIKQQKLEAERRAAEMMAQQAARDKEEAQKYARLAEAAKKEALQQIALAKQAKEEAQRQKKEAEAARLVALQAKDQAEIATQEALQEKQRAEVAQLKAQREAEAARQVALQAKDQAETATQEALLEKQRAEKARLNAQQEAEAARQRLQELQKKLTLLSAEFAKVKEEKRGLVVTLSDILFDVDKATIRPGAAKNLMSLAQILKEYPDRKILIEGHTDSTGPAEYNQSLSEERAFAVMGSLMSQGLDPKMIDAKGFGETKPVATNETAEGRQQNRRVDIIILNPKS